MSRLSRFRPSLGRFFKGNSTPPKHDHGGGPGLEEGGGVDVRQAGNGLGFNPGLGGGAGGGPGGAAGGGYMAIPQHAATERTLPSSGAQKHRQRDGAGLGMALPGGERPARSLSFDDHSQRTLAAIVGGDPPSSDTPKSPKSPLTLRKRMVKRMAGAASAAKASATAAVKAAEALKSHLTPGSPVMSVLVRRHWRQGEQRGIFHPYDTPVQRWSLHVFLVLLVQAPLLPLQLAFLRPEQEADWPWCMWMDCWSDLVMWLDMVMQFFLQVMSKDRSHWISDRATICKGYLRGQFVVDLLSVLPLRRVASSWAPDATGITRTCVALVGFIRMLRFVRMARVVRTLRESKTAHVYLQYTYTRNMLFRSIVTVLFTVHATGCLWATLAMYNHDDSCWFDFLAAYKGLQQHDFYMHMHPASVYIASLYWAVATMTGVGFGDVVATNTMEYSMAIVVMMGTALTWASVVANIVSVVANNDKATNEHLHTLDCINSMLNDHSVQIHLSRRLREYFTKMKDVKEWDFVSTLISRMSPQLSVEVVYAIHSPWIEKVWWLKELPPTSFMVDLTQGMSNMLHMPNEFLPNKQELCIVMQGLCIHGGQLMTKGTAFGEDMLINNALLRRPFATLALTFLNLLVLTKQTLELTLIQHPEVQESVRKCYVYFVVIRGILYKAAQHRSRRTAFLARSRMKQRDEQDVPRRYSSEADAHDRSQEFDMSKSKLLNLQGSAGQRSSVNIFGRRSVLVDQQAANPSSSERDEVTTQAGNWMMQVTASPSGSPRKHQQGVVPAGSPRRSPSYASTAGLPSPTTSDVNGMLLQAKETETRLLARMGGLESSVAALVEKVRLLSEL